LAFVYARIGYLAIAASLLLIFVFSAVLASDPTKPEPVIRIDPARPRLTPPPGRSAVNADFIWPAGGPVTSFQDWRHPLGIDIGLGTNPGAPIVAARSGVVSFVGGDECCGYGYHVQVDHGGGLTSLYAHLADIWVQHGQEVRQGHLLGIGGDTGNSVDGEHLHFEVVQDGEYLDPLGLLPRIAAYLD